MLVSGDIQAGARGRYNDVMSAAGIQDNESIFATTAELQSLRAEVAELRMQVAGLRAPTAPGEWQKAIAKLQAGYASLSPEAQELHADATAEARSLLNREPDGG